MAVELFANQPSTVVSSGGTDAPASGTSQSWTVSSSGEFPSASSGASPPTLFHICDVATGFTSEIIAVTNVSGTTWTVTRGAESTTPVAHAAGFTVQQTVTAGNLGNFAQVTGTGDLGGSGTGPVVEKLQGTSLSAPSGGSTHYLNASGTWTVPAGGGGSGIPVVSPSNDATGATDKSNINTALAGGGYCQLLQGVYYINGPLLPTASGSAASGLVGVQPGYASTEDFYGINLAYPTGTIIRTTSSFSGEAAILMDNETSTQYAGPYLANFYLDCTAMPVQTGGNEGDGIEVTGPWGAGRMANVTVLKPQGNCFSFYDANTGSGNPDEWLLTACKASGAKGTASFSGSGFALAHVPDAVFSDCNASECNQDAWLLNGVDNAMFSNCKGENSGANGWHCVGFYGPDQYVVFNGCTTNINIANGWLFDSSSGDTGRSTYLLNGCKATYDNNGNGGYSGFAAGTCTSRVVLTGCFAGGTISNGTFIPPKYGVSQVSSYYVYVAGGYYYGTTASFFNGSGNTHAMGTAAIAAF